MSENGILFLFLKKAVKKLSYIIYNTPQNLDNDKGTDKIVNL